MLDLPYANCEIMSRDPLELLVQQGFEPKQKHARHSQSRSQSQPGPPETSTGPAIPAAPELVSASCKLTSRAESQEGCPVSVPLHEYQAVPRSLNGRKGRSPKVKEATSEPYVEPLRCRNSSEQSQTQSKNPRSKY